MVLLLLVNFITIFIIIVANYIFKIIIIISLGFKRRRKLHHQKKMVARIKSLKSREERKEIERNKEGKCLT